MPESEHGPWNPGLKSQIPTRLLPLSTVFRPENTERGFGEAQELAAATGLAPFDLVAFRPERLVAHEVLIRVTADLRIPDGPRYADLGVNLRGMVTTILDRHVAAAMPELVEAFTAFRDDVSKRLRAEIASFGSPKPPDEPAPAPSVLSRLLGRGAAPEPPRARPPDDTERALAALTDWGRRAEAAADPIEAGCLAALAWAAGAILRTRGRLLADPDLLEGIARARVCNAQGSAILGEAVAAPFREACAAEGFEWLPPQDEPVIMNVKGASASGKSTMRSFQRELAGKIGVPWEDFALISPDYWRKFLLDYGSLGEDYKYAASLTGHELSVIDLKLDRHMARKAVGGQTTHMLIDRFRFDSFSAERDHPADSSLLTRFGKTIYLFFMVTPPEATVERAWIRGLETGRFKAVDDLLYHNIEAFTGMSQLFFQWALSKGKDVHFEFLDNSVPKGQRPRTIASGWNGAMNVYDVGGLLNIERFQRIDIAAKGPDGLYEERSEAAAGHDGFLAQCLKRLETVRFVEPANERCYGLVERGEWRWRDTPPSAVVAEVMDRLDGGRGSAGVRGDGEASGSLEKERSSIVGSLASSSAG